MTEAMNKACKKIIKIKSIPYLKSAYSIGNTSIVCTATRDLDKIQEEQLEDIKAVLKGEGFEYVDHKIVYDPRIGSELYLDVLHKDTNPFHRPLKRYS